MKTFRRIGSFLDIFTRSQIHSLVDMELQPHICTHIFKNVINLYVCIKLIFLLTISLSDLFPWWI